MSVDSRFVDDDQAIAFSEVDIIFLSLFEVVQRSDNRLSCRSNNTSSSLKHSSQKLFFSDGWVI